MEGGVNSLSILISSPTYASSYTQQRIQQAIGNPMAKVIKGRLWDVKPKGTYSEKMFHVFLGSEKLDPFIINNIGDLNQVLGAESIPDVTEGELNSVIQLLPARIKTLVDQIPVDFLPGFQTGLIASIQDIAGYSVAPQGRLFSSRVVFNSCIEESLTEYFHRVELVVSTEDRSESNNITSYMKGWLDRREKYRYVHLDQSVNN